jgi:cytosine/uracil/thiamine/allantoin permease
VLVFGGKLGTFGANCVGLLLHCLCSTCVERFIELQTKKEENKKGRKGESCYFFVIFHFLAVAEIILHFSVATIRSPETFFCPCHILVAD